MKPQTDKPRFQKIFLMLGGSVIGIFACMVLLGILIFRTEVRKQILQRDGSLLSNVTQYLHQGYETEINELDLLDLALESSEIKGIIAVRVFHPPDRLIEQVPDTLYPVSLAADDLAILSTGKPVNRYFPDFQLDTLFSDTDQVDSEAPTPIVEVLTPVFTADRATGAVIQYWMDGSEIAREFSRLDRFLWVLGTGMILGGIIIFTIVFLYARHRLIGMARLLSERNASLEAANTELARAARTSAIGSVTSHLFHGLKNPLAGLKAYLKLTSGDEEAMAITNRMQTLIDETLEVIREEDQDTDARLSLDEFSELATSRLGARDASKSTVQIHGDGEAALPLRKAQLALLVLRNLVDNAIEASPAGVPVEVTLLGKATTLSITVKDQGPGLPQSVRRHLFQPVKSSKQHGTGIGLAISAVIARHIPATLNLESEPEASGTTFNLSIPL